MEDAAAAASTIAPPPVPDEDEDSLFADPETTVQNELHEELLRVEIRIATANVFEASKQLLVLATRDPATVRAFIRAQAETLAIKGGRRVTSVEL